MLIFGIFGCANFFFMWCREVELMAEGLSRTQRGGGGFFDAFTSDLFSNKQMQ